MHIIYNIINDLYGQCSYTDHINVTMIYMRLKVQGNKV